MSRTLCRVGWAAIDQSNGHLTLRNRKSGLHLPRYVMGRGRLQITAEAAERALKDLVHEKWANQGCEDHTDTLKMIGLVSFFLPYFPLERSHLLTLFSKQVAMRAPGLSPSPAIFSFLADKVTSRPAFPPFSHFPMSVDFTLSLSLGYQCQAYRLGQTGKVVGCFQCSESKPTFDPVPPAP